MDLYTLDANFQRGEVVDIYNSLIWTERYSESGDATVVFPENSPTADLLRENSFIWLDGSQDVVLLETISTKEGVVTATGKTLTDFLKQRFYRDSWESAVGYSNILTYTISNLCSTIIFEMCAVGGSMADGEITPIGGADEVIPGLDPYGLTVAGDVISASIPFDNLYTIIKSLCDLESYGFRIVPKNITASDGATRFDTYLGLDRTSDQDDNAVVYFEAAMDSLAEIEELRSIENYKNVAYAWAANMPDKAYIGYAVVPGPVPTGFNRRTLMVDASDIDAVDITDPGELKSVLDTRAMNELIKNNYVRSSDGKIIPQNTFVYGRDYGLGDIIELRSKNGSQKARIIEYIRSQDDTGEVAYPTLSVV